MTLATFEVSLWSQISYFRKIATSKGGNVSVLRGNTVYIKPSGLSFFDIMPWNISLVDLNGNPKNRFKPSSEYPMHLEIYKTVPTIKAVMHTHSFYATVFAFLKEEIPILTEEARVYLKKIPLVSYEEPGSQALGKAVATCLSQGFNSALLESHGTVVIGKNLKECYYLSELLEESAKLAWFLRKKDNI